MMTPEEDLEEFKKRLDEHSKQYIGNPEKCREYLRELGIIDEDGDLTEYYSHDEDQIQEEKLLLDIFFRKNIKDNFYIKKSPPRREWMDNTDNKFAYRCLPLNIANMYGWTIYLSCDIEAEWNGGSQQDDLVVRCDKNYVASSHFGSGIITFTPSYLVRTEPGYDLFIAPVPNEFKHGAQALSAIVETSWIPYTFTLNWKLTAPGKVEFKKDTPLAVFFPVKKHVLEEFDPVLHEHKELDKKTKIEEVKWGNERRFREANMKEHERQHLLYTKGQFISGEKTADHETKLSHKEFEEK